MDNYKLHYTLPFRSLHKNTLYTIQIYELVSTANEYETVRSDWYGRVTDGTYPVTELTGSEEPFETEMDDDDDFTKAYRGQTGHLNIVTKDRTLLNALMPDSPQQLMLRVYSGEYTSSVEDECTLEWSGFLQMEASDQSYLQYAWEINIPVISALGLWAETYLPVTYTGPVRMFDLLRRWLCGTTYIDYVFRPHYTKLAWAYRGGSVWDFTCIGFVEENFKEVDEWKWENDTDVCYYDPDTYGDVMDSFFGLFGFVAEEDGGILYLKDAMDIANNYINVAVNEKDFGMTSYNTTQPDDILGLAFSSNDMTEKYVNPRKQIYIHDDGADNDENTLLGIDNFKRLTKNGQFASNFPYCETAEVTPYAYYKGTDTSADLGNYDSYKIYSDLFHGYYDTRTTPSTHSDLCGGMFYKDYADDEGEKAQVELIGIPGLDTAVPLLEISPINHPLNATFKISYSPKYIDWTKKESYEADLPTCETALGDGETIRIRVTMEYQGIGTNVKSVKQYLYLSSNGTNYGYFAASFSEKYQSSIITQFLLKYVKFTFWSDIMFSTDGVNFSKTDKMIELKDFKIENIASADESVSVKTKLSNVRLEDYDKQVVLSAKESYKPLLMLGNDGAVIRVGNDNGYYAWYDYSDYDYKRVADAQSLAESLGKILTPLIKKRQRLVEIDERRGLKPTDRVYLDGERMQILAIDKEWWAENNHITLINVGNTPTYAIPGQAMANAYLLEEDYTGIKTDDVWTDTDAQIKDIDEGDLPVDYYDFFDTEPEEVTFEEAATLNVRFWTPKFDFDFTEIDYSIYINDCDDEAVKISIGTAVFVKAFNGYVDYILLSDANDGQIQLRVWKDEAMTKAKTVSARIGFAKLVYDGKDYRPKNPYTPAEPEPEPVLHFKPTYISDLVYTRLVSITSDDEVLENADLSQVTRLQIEGTDLEYGVITYVEAIDKYIKFTGSEGNIDLGCYLNPESTSADDCYFETINFNELEYNDNVYLPYEEDEE